MSFLDFHEEIKHIDILEEENKKLNNRILELKSELEELGIDNKIKDEFIANIYHEVRTPLNIILSVVQLYESKLSDKGFINEEKSTEYLKTIRNSCYLMLKMANNIIDTNKLESGYFKLELKNHNIVSVVEDVTMLTREYAKIKEIEIIFDTEEEEIILACDIDKIERVIMNLLSNSIKFTPKGGIIIVTIYKNINNIVLAVKDNGVGIDKEKQELLFKRYYKAHDKNKIIAKGSGIGLSLVKLLVEMHRGSIAVDSEEGKGTEFKLYLPSNILNEEVNYNSSREDKIKEELFVELSDII
ncbi:sensor histidine kinase [Clostridium sp.]|uniref:sensor histidine kinase n=1 Tax=Clostridium sp. TaxID=1506 RepID=UPI003464DFDF